MKVSIIIPVYNKEKYIQTILHQIRIQTFTDFECWLIDDGSTDLSGLFCDTVAKQDPRFKVQHVSNGGVSNARNLGIELSKGKYITFIDADDQIHTDYLQNLYQCAEESGAPIVIGNLKKIWDAHKKEEIIDIPYQGLYTIEELLPEFAKIQQSTGIYGYCTAKLLRRDLLTNIRFSPDIKLAEDLNFYLDIYPTITHIFFDKKPYYLYLQEADNSSMQGDWRKFDYYTQLQIQMKIQRFLENKHALYGDNAMIMNKRIYDYVFFCMINCQKSQIEEMCTKLCSLSIANKPVFTTEIYKTILLRSVWRKRTGIVKTLLYFRLFLKKMLNKVKG